MNKQDIILCIIIFIISILIYGIFKFNNKSINEAYVYYNNNKILTIDLSKNDIYTVNGYNGEVKIEVNDYRIRVIDEISPKHLCSKQGYIKESYESIICLPNKIVITMGNNSDIDTVVK